MNSAQINQALKFLGGFDSTADALRAISEALMTEEMGSDVEQSTVVDDAVERMVKVEAAQGR